MALEVSDEAKDNLAMQGYDVRYGARPLARTIQNNVLAPLSRKLLEGTVREGDVVQVVLGEDENVIVKDNHVENIK